MTSALSPVAPVALSREGSPISAIGGAQAALPAAPVETARAPRPVDPGGGGEAVRNLSQRAERGQGARGAQVGPPPAFEVNVLQDIRSRLSDASAHLDVRL